MSAAPEDIKVGAQLVSPPYLLDNAAAAAYLQGVEEPPRRHPRGNIHDDDAAARAAGFPAPIAAGEQTIAIIAQFLADRFGMRFMRGGRIEVVLIKPVFFGDTLTSHVSVVSVDPARAVLEIHVENQHREQVLKGSAALRMGAP